MAEAVGPADASQRKLLGAFYTEGETANVIARIAIDRADQNVLDPSFGGCAFLEAVRHRLLELGNGSPMKSVFGVDVDPAALKYLKGVPGARPNQFLVRDFLDLEPEVFGQKFAVVVGNPPFIRHHLQTRGAVSKGQARLSRELRVPKTADTWLYFFHHSLQFLRAGGCLAMVLPGSFLNAAYAESARSAIATRFASADLFLVRRRLFADALEAPVIVIARGFGEPPQGCRLSVVDSPNEIPAAVASAKGAAVDLSGRTGPWRVALLPRSARDAFAETTHRESVAQLGSLASIRIGVVTGANHFFTLSDVDAKANQLPESALRAILTTSKQFSGLEATTAGTQRLRRDGERILLVDTLGVKSARLERYLNSPSAKAAQAAFKCRDRETWHELRDLAVPDAFLSYVVDRLPRIVLNAAGILCTNAIHRVWWRARCSRASRQGWSLGIISSLGGISAELYGRSMGGGALKLEPSEAAALWLPTSFARPARVSAAFSAASKALRTGDWEQARDIADAAILRDELGLTAATIAAMRDGHDSLLALRFSLAARLRTRAL